MEVWKFAETWGSKVADTYFSEGWKIADTFFSERWKVAGKTYTFFLRVVSTPFMPELKLKV